jgi:SAM-dependent methyltransferase
VPTQPKETSSGPDAASPLAPVLADLGHTAADLAPGDGTRASLVERAGERSPESLVALAGERLGEAGVLLLTLEAQVEERELALWRNRLWPLLHAVAVYRVGPDGSSRTSLSGRAELAPVTGQALTVLAMRRTAHLLAPEATREKFDQNAAGWNGEPGGPGYPHFRWMRRFVGRFAPVPAAARILDFGCGAGWCGIEAALAAPAPPTALHFFDPSPEMVRIAAQNARAAGITAAEGRVGFGEAPPFPAKDEAPYQLVISSGVVSFARDFDAWMGGLLEAVAPGGTLVIGDLDPRSRGMLARRRTRPLVPLRELNGKVPAEVRTWLERAGLRYLDGAGYQLSWPLPQMRHLNETRLGGWLSRPLVGIEAAAAGLDRRLGARAVGRFDSWVMRFERPAPRS